MTKINAVISVAAALFSLPAFADQIWWTTRHDLVFDHTGKVDIGTYTCTQTSKGTNAASPAELYKIEKLTNPDVKIIDKGDEVDVAHVAFYRSEEACNKAIIPASRAAAAKAAADAAARAAEEKYLEKYR